MRAAVIFFSACLGFSLALLCRGGVLPIWAVALIAVVAVVLLVMLQVLVEYPEYKRRNPDRLEGERNEQ